MLTKFGGDAEAPHPSSGETRATSASGRPSIGALRAHPIVLCALLFVTLILLGWSIIYLLYDAKASASGTLIFEREKQAVDLARLKVSASLDGVVADAEYLASLRSLRQFMASPSSVGRQTASEALTEYAKYRGLYDQIRLFDLAGREIVRIDWNNGDSKAAPEAQLQDEGDRSYVAESLKLRPREVYFSPIDLKMDDGVIESPIKPTARAGIQVLDSAGKKNGFLTLSYLADHTLSQLRGAAPSTQGDLWLLNGEGYWLVGPPSDEWAFMYPDRSDRSFGRSYSPDAWRKIRENPASGQIFAGKDLVTYASLTPLSQNQTGAAEGVGGDKNPLFIVTRIPAAHLAEMKWDVRGRPGYLNRFSASISGASAGVRLPCGLAAG